MNNERHLLRTVLIFIVFSLVVVFTACKTEDVTKRAENEEKVLKAMIEYPGDGLYDPVVTVIGIGVDEPSEEELAAAEQRAAEEKQLWQDKVGDCFADGMFDTFYGKWYRTEVLGIAMNSGLTTTISQFGIQGIGPALGRGVDAPQGMSAGFVAKVIGYGQRDYCSSSTR